mgnify:CR=1 FL=1
MPDRSTSERLAALRRQVEARLCGLPVPTPPEEAITPAETARLLHELEVQRLELEVQNDELRAAQLELQASRDRWFALYDLAPVGYLTLDPEGGVHQANLQAASMLGRERSRLVGGRLQGFLAPTSLAPLREHLRGVFGGTGELECELELGARGGPPRQVRLRSEAIAPGEDGPRCRSVLVDVSELVGAERRARHAAERLQAVLDTATDGIVALDAQGTIESWNRAAGEMFGHSTAAVLGRPLGQLLDPADGRELHEDLRRGEPRLLAEERELTGLRADGSRFQLVLRLGVARGPTGGRAYTALLRDLSERKRLEDQLRQSQKLEPVGRLTSELAHEYRNLLMGIEGFTSMALDALQDSPARRWVEEVRAAAGRGSALAAQLLAFTRKEQVSREPHELDQLVGEAGKLLRALLRAEVVLELDLQAPLACVEVGPGDLEQVLLNLAVNASDAMPQGGRLAIRTRFRADQRALIQVQDQGTGMDAATRRRLFEPFFTTKPHGTGLGLAAIQRVVGQLGGRIEVASAPGQGTTFSLVLPLAPRLACEEPPHPAPSGAGSQEEAVPPARPLTVLAVEDERLVLVTVEHYLLRAGYRPLMAEDPREALELASRAAPGSIDLLLTDVSLPGMGGRQLAEEVRRRHPGVAVLFMSAFPRAQLLEEGRIDPASPTLEKPFDEEQLARRLAELRA